MHRGYVDSIVGVSLIRDLVDDGVGLRESKEGLSDNE